MADGGRSKQVVFAGRRVQAGFEVVCRWVTRRLGFGGMIGTRANLEALAAEGVTHLLGLQAEFDDRALARGTGVEVLWLPVEDQPAVPRPADIRNGVAFALAALDRPGCRVLVHCLAGRNRSPAFVYAILRARGLGREEARDRVLDAGAGEAELPEPMLAAVEAALDAEGA